MCTYTRTLPFKRSVRLKYVCLYDICEEILLKNRFSYWKRLLRAFVAILEVEIDKLILRNIILI